MFCHKMENIYKELTLQMQVLCLIPKINSSNQDFYFYRLENKMKMVMLLLTIIFFSLGE